MYEAEVLVIAFFLFVQFPPGMTVGFVLFVTAKLSVWMLSMIVLKRTLTLRTVGRCIHMPLHNFMNA